MTRPAFNPETSPPPPIIMRSVGTLYLAAEAPKGANLVVRDSSRGSPMTDAELKASIYAKGVIQPLIWKTHQGKDYVVAGNRRLRFLREIFADALATSVQTQNVDDFGGDWREVAIDTNLSLPPHLVERYEMIVALAKDLKLSEADVCTRFGMSDQQYRRVMALGKMAPLVRQAWKEAAIDAKTAQAFTLEPDPKEQEKIFASLTKNSHNGHISDYEVRRKIVPQSQSDIGKFVAFVGVEAVRKAKLFEQEDMFSNNHIVTEPKALNKLVGDRLVVKCNELMAAGWSWAIPEDKMTGNQWEYGSIDPKKTTETAAEKARLAEIERLLDVEGLDSDQEDDLIAERDRIDEGIKLRGFTPEQMKKSGCILKISRDGELNIEYGRTKPSDKKKVEASERPKAAKKPPKKPGVVTLTNALAERLSLQLEEAVAVSIAAKPHVAVAALIAGFASSGHVVDVGVGGGNGYTNKANENDFVKIFEGALKASAESRVVMLAGVVAGAIAVQVHSAESKPPLDGKGLQALTAAMDGKVLNKALYENFDASGYFTGVSLEACVAAVRCSLGDDLAAKVAKMKKGEAAKFAAANVPPKLWLPKELRTVHYAGPVEKVAPAKPAKKAETGADKLRVKKAKAKAKK